MKAAVLLSAYNGEQYIKTQIDSILAQQCPISFELWVRDDGSTDGTHQILQQYADRGKLQWYTGKNLRSAKSFLDLLSHCPGYDYYAFADQDDFWKPDKLACGIEKLQGLSCPGLYVGNARLVGSQLEDLGRDVYQCDPYHDFYTLVCEGGLLGCTMIFNAALSQRIQNAPVPEAVIMHDFYAAVVCDLFDGQIIFDPTAHILYRQHGNNVVGVSQSKLQAFKNRLNSITKKSKISVAQQARSILKCYPSIPNPDKKAWLERIAGYQDSFSKALSLALSSKTHYCSKNKAITLRLALMLRNR